MVDAIKEIKTTYSIIDTATRMGMEIKQSQRHAITRCPFCDDETGHLYLYPDTNRFHCFKCQQSGDALDLLGKYRNLSSREAISEIKSMYGYQNTNCNIQPLQAVHIQPSMPPETPPAETSIPIRDYSSLYFEIAATWELTETGKNYLTQTRGLSEKIIGRYDIRSIDDPKATAKALLEAYELETLIDAGLFSYSKNGKPYFTFFLPSIVFPHWSIELTKITYLSTRNLTGDTKSFKLSNVTSRLYFGQDALTARNVYIFEGIISALSFAELTGKDNFIALNGLITPQKFTKLRELMPNQKLILALDPDPAGKKAINEIQGCYWMDWADIAEQITGKRQLPTHPDGKAFDANDYLLLNKRQQ